MPFKFSKKFLLISFLIILIVAGSVFAAYHFYFQRTPQRIVRTMVRNMRDVKSFHYETNLTIKSDVPMNSLFGNPSSNSSIQKVTANLDASGSLNNFDKPQFSSIFDLKLGQESIKISLAKGEIRGLDKTLYFRFNQLLQFGIFNLDRLENKWFKVDLNEYQANEKVNIDYNKLLDNIENKLSLKQKKELENLIEETNFFIITNVLPDENVNGVNTHHYDYRLNGIAFRDFLSKAKDILHGNNLSPKEELQLNKMLAQLSNVKGELWIGTKDNLLYKLIVNYDFVLDHGKNIKTQMKAVIELSQFNKHVNITVPKEAQSLKTFANLIPSFSNLSQTTTPSSSTSSS